MHSWSGVSTKISTNSSAATSSRTIRRSARNGEMKEHSTIRPVVDEEPGDLADAADVLDSS
jgi:hypothetical protein